MMITTAALIRDTFREAFARKIFWGLFALSTLMILFFLFILKIDVVEGAIATVTLFGRPAGPRGGVDVDRLVRNVYGGIATFLYTWGMALSVFASAGLIPSVLEPGRIELLLSKPVSRLHILLGRFLGNVAVVACNVAYLVLGIWTIFGVKTGVWGPQFLWAIATTVFIFAVLLTVVVLVGVVFESAALATMVTIALGLVSPILAQTTTMVRLLSSELARDVWRALYHALPKVYDLGRLTLDLVRREPAGDLTPVFSSALFGAAALSLALYIFSRRDF
ncbi:MAG TPA: ABC transporter permease subunit [Bryobacteraceae bacterium]|nr:ABC transporter permease subunit [Bryobacteraceae bacterium]